MAPREGGDIGDVERRAARGHVRVLERDHRYVRLVVVLGLDDVEDVAQGERTIGVVDRRELDGRVARRGAHLEADHVLASAGDDEVAGIGEYPNGDLVAHHARRHEDRRLFSDQRGEPVLQGSNRRVFVVAVVAHDGDRHGVAHRLRRLRHRVASQINSSGHHQRLSANFYTVPMYEDMVKRMNERQNVHTELGIDVVSVSPDKVVLQVEVGPAVHQAAGHLARRRVGADGRRRRVDRGAVSVAPGEIVVGTELNCSHLRSMTSGTLTATATPVRKGRTVHVWGIELTDETGRLICVARCSLQVLKAPSAPSA